LPSFKKKGLKARNAKEAETKDKFSSLSLKLRGLLLLIYYNVFKE